MEANKTDRDWVCEPKQFSILAHPYTHTHTHTFKKKSHTQTFTQINTDSTYYYSWPVLDNPNIIISQSTKHSNFLTIRIHNKDIKFLKNK